MAKRVDDEKALFHPINIPKPTDLIIREIYGLLVDGSLNPGDRLPPENIIASQLEVRRNDVKEALSKLEFLGILKTIPQSGTYIAQTMGALSLQTIVSNVLCYNQDHIPSLLDTREILEIRAAELAAAYATNEELSILRGIHKSFIEEIAKGNQGLDEDYAFHFKIAAVSHSPFLMNFLTMLLPDYMRLCERTNRIDDGRYRIVVEEHTNIQNAIESRNCEAAAEAMRTHMKRIKKNRLTEINETQL